MFKCLYVYMLFYYNKNRILCNAPIQTAQQNKKEAKVPFLLINKHKSKQLAINSSRYILL